MKSAITSSGFSFEYLSLAALGLHGNEGKSPGLLEEASGPLCAARKGIVMEQKFKMVPVEPTDEMLNVMHERVLISVNTRKQEANILNDKAWWAAVVDAAPQPPALVGEPEVFGVVYRDCGEIQIGVRDESSFKDGMQVYSAASIAPIQTENARLRSAARTLERLGYTDNGGERWKPPLGNKPDFDMNDRLHERVAELEKLYKGAQRGLLKVQNELSHLRGSCKALGAENTALKTRIKELEIWERFAGYLLDHCEGQAIYEERLQYWLSECIKNYSAKTTEGAQS